MPEPLDDRLAGLRSTPVPPLAPAAAVRARGDRRRSRHRAALAAAAALAAVGVLGAVALSAGGSAKPDSLQPAPFASEPAGATAMPAPSPLLDPEPSPVMKEPPPAPWAMTEAFLPPEAAGEAEQPGWTVTSQLDPQDGPVADPCREGSAPLAEEVVEVVGRAMGSSREVGGSNLAQEVYRYSSPQSAADAFAVYEERYARCAEVPDDQAPEGQTIRSEVVDRAPDRLLVRRIPCMSGGCTDHFSTYEMVVRVQDAVTVVAYAIAEDGDPAQDARALVAAVERRLREVVGG